MNTINKLDTYTLNHDAVGRVKIWQVDLKTGSKELLVDKPNLITYQGAGILAASLAGAPGGVIDHFYVGYGTSATPPSVAVTDTVTSFSTTGGSGYLRLPLAFPPSFLTESGYPSPNAPYFTTFITSGSGTGTPGGSFVDNVYITSLGLINAGGTDKLFSKIAFSGIQYTGAYGLAITWGITFRAQ